MRGITMHVKRKENAKIKELGGAGSKQGWCYDDENKNKELKWGE